MKDFKKAASLFRNWYANGEDVEQNRQFCLEQGVKPEDYYHKWDSQGQ
jgi:hypothetical protein